VSALPLAEIEKTRTWEQQIIQVKQTFEKQLQSERTLKTQVRERQGTPGRGGDYCAGLLCHRHVLAFFCSNTSI